LKKEGEVIEHVELEKEREKAYIEDELLVHILPSQASPEIDEPNEY